MFISVHAGKRKSATVSTTLYGVCSYYLSQYVQVSQCTKQTIMSLHASELQGSILLFLSIHTRMGNTVPTGKFPKLNIKEL